jgi:plastocyanin
MDRRKVCQRLVIGLPFAVAIALLSLVAVGFNQSTASAQGTQAVTISGFAFNPASLTIEAGTTVTWTNQDSATHTATADDGSWDTGNLAQGASGSITFDTPGTYTYHCAIHPNMTASITVTEAGAPAPTQAPSEPTQAPSQMPTTGSGPSSGGPVNNTVLISAAVAALLLGAVAIGLQRKASSR